MHKSAEIYAKALYGAIKQSEAKEMDALFTRFAQILAAEGKLNFQPEIERQLETLLLKEKGVAMAELTAARDLKLDSGTQILLEKLVGKKLHIRQKVDPSLIGGIVLRVEDLLFDGSIKKRLDHLRAELQA